MARLARPASELRSRYDAVVVGSGYGGGVAALRLARMGLSVAVLERGREIVPGEFPTTAAGVRRELQTCLGGIRSGAPDGLFDLRIGPDGAVLGGCGVGGTSLISAGICLAPDMLLLEDACWPAALRADHYLAVGFHRARAMLCPEPLPDADCERLSALERSGAAIGRAVGRLPLHIAFAKQGGPGHATRPECSRCGGCLTGCNLGAKTTVHSSYLADAVRHGAEVFTHALVRYVEAHEGSGWRVAVLHRDEDAGPMPLGSITAKFVFLAAGTLGTVDILRRSRERGLPLSERLGAGVFTNGGMAVAAAGAQAVEEKPHGRGRAKPPGPISTGFIDLRRRRKPGERLIVTDALLPALLLDVLQGGAAPGSLGSDAAERDPERRAAGLPLLYALGHDPAASHIARDGDGVVLQMPACTQGIGSAAEKVLHRLAGGGDAQGAAGPKQMDRLLGDTPLVLFPVGGAGMGETRDAGVVDHRCRVFDGDPVSPEQAVHEGLFVVDGSVMPRSLGVHPLLMITAVAERALQLFAREHGLALADEPAGAAVSPGAPVRRLDADRSAPAPFAR